MGNGLDDRRLVFIGAGRVATTLARAMQGAGLAVAAVHSRSAANAARLADQLAGTLAASSLQAAADAGDCVFLTVPDDRIRETCERVTWRSGQWVVHCSGATELDALRSASAAGAGTAALHPLQMFANPDVALVTLPGCTITIEAQPPLEMALHQLVVRLGCRPVRLSGGDRALYHAGAYYAGPFLIALMCEATTIWQSLGMSEADALAALVPLLRGTVAAVLDQGLAGGMGGCVARGDVGTVERHVTALDAFAPEVSALYRHLALRTIPLAIERGTLSADGAERIREALRLGR